MFTTNRAILRKPSQAIFFALLLMLAFTIAAPVNTARADNLSEGMELYQQKKYKEATPYLEKAAQEGQEEAIAALDVIYAADTPAVPENDKAPAKGKKAAVTKKAATTTRDVAPADEPEAKTQYDRATVTEDPKETDNRAFMRKMMFLGTAIIIFILWIVQYMLMKKLRNKHFRKMTPEELAKEAEKNKQKK